MPTPTLRRATPADLDLITSLEAAAFLPAEAADRDRMAARLARFADRFWILFSDGEPVSYVGGLLTNAAILTDDMYADPAYHDPAGRIQMIFSVATHPAHQHRGYASHTLRAVIDDCRAEGREALVLTCKRPLIPFYASLGFVLQGPSDSEHGGAAWYQMRLDCH